MGLVDKIKKDVQKSGGTRSKFTYIRDGQKVRVRFLTDMDDGIEVVFHDSFERGINVPCRETFGKDCPYCGDEDLRTRSQYIWSVWNYDTKQVELFMFRVNNCSPIPALMAMYENYGTIVDRDYIVSCSGKQTNKSFTVIPMDKVKFRNSKAKAFSKSAILKMIDKAYPDDNHRPDSDFDDDDDSDDTAGKYDDMKPVELYKLCKDRKIDCEPKKPKKLYINLLEEWDNAQDDWGEDGADDDDGWDDDWDDED